MKLFHTIFVYVLLPVLGMAWTLPAKAVPAFARKYEKRCSYCHAAWPQLNKKGRSFKELGYRLSADDQDNVEEWRAQLEQLQRASNPGWESNVPLSAVAVARPYDERDSGKTMMRALHEIELFYADSLGTEWSAFAEIKAEDETDFGLKLAPAMLAYNPASFFNVSFVWGPAFWADAYGLLDSRFRLTSGHVALIDQSFGGGDANGKIRSDRQNVSVWGNLWDRLHYAVGISGKAGDTEGIDSKSTHARLALDITSNIMIGTFGLKGKTDAYIETSTTTQTVGGVPGVLVETQTAIVEADFSRYGLDLQADLFNTRLQAAVVRAEDDFSGRIQTLTSDAWTVQAFYAFRSPTGQPSWVPLIRFDRYERKNSADQYDEITLNLTYYFTQSVKGYIEYWDQVDTPTSANSGFGEDKRLTLQLHVAL